MCKKHLKKKKKKNFVQAVNGVNESSDEKYDARK